MAFNIDAVDTDAQSNGVWEEYQGSEFLIASTANIRYQKRLATLRKPLSRQIDKGTADPEELNRIFCKAISERILLDWKNVVDSNGKAIDYSPEIAQKSLETNDTFASWVLEVAGNQEFYEREFKDAVVKK